jgi:hypothetical protein
MSLHSRFAFFLVALVGSAGSTLAGSVFLTGHDPDFHATLGGNLGGARKINQVGISFVMDPAFNPYFAGGATKFLFVESRIPTPAGHTVGKNGIIASGYTEGVNFDHADASTLNAAIGQLGTTYSAIVVASDFGGLLTQAELNILNARATDIASFVNSGGGLYAMAEGNGGAGLTPGGGHFGYVPIVTTSVALDQSEVGNTVTPFGASIGLTDSDANGNASHIVFNNIGTLEIVDRDAAGRILTVAGRVSIPTPGALATISLAGLIVSRRRRLA